jgi:hypothetical protein
MKWWENNEVSKHIKVNYLHHYGSHRKKDNWDNAISIHAVSQIFIIANLRRISSVCFFNQIMQHSYKNITLWNTDNTFCKHTTQRSLHHSPFNNCRHYLSQNHYMTWQEKKENSFSKCGLQWQHVQCCTIHQQVPRQWPD